MWDSRECRLSLWHVVLQVKKMQSNIGIIRCKRNNSVFINDISMGWCKKDVTPLLTHWSYVFLPLSHRYEKYSNNKSDLTLLCIRINGLWQPFWPLLLWVFLLHKGTFWTYSIKRLDQTSAVRRNIIKFNLHNSRCITNISAKWIYTNILYKTEKTTTILSAKM